MANPKIQLRHDTSANWQTQNPVLLEGEVAIETDSNKVKIGNGTDNYNTLPYITDQTKIDLDYSNADYQPVNKAGDTMTGALNITAQYAGLILKGIDPSSTQTNYRDIAYFNNTNYRVAGLRASDNGSQNGIQIFMCKHGTDDNAGAVFQAFCDSSGNKYCTFSSTDCCDGQYVNKNTTIASNVSVNGSSSLTYTLNLPSDGHDYMVWIMAEGDTGTTSGNYINVKVGSDIMTSTSLARATTRTTSGVSAGSTACIVVSSSHKIYLGRASNWHGTVKNLIMIGYRRIGTNA